MHRNSNPRDVGSLVLEGGGRAGRFGRLLGSYFRADRAGIVAFGVILLLCASFAHAQTGIRWDLGAPGSAGAVTAGTQGGLPALRAQPGVSLAWCNHPANALPCTNYATTYTSLSLQSSCPNNSQIVLQGANSCVATGDNFGNLGVYTASNATCTVTCYDYTLTVNGVSYGPFVWTMGGAGSGSGSLPAASAAGQYPNSTAPGTTYTAQSKPWIDPRDYGVDCTDASDSTVAWANAVTAAGNYGKILVPEHCLFRLNGAVGWTLYKVYGLEVEFAGRQGNGCDNQGPNPAGIDYRQAYAGGNSVVSIKDSQRLLFKNLTIYTNGGADTGILIDQDGLTPPINTRNDFYNICIYNNTASRNSAWAGISVSPVSISNVENQHFYHPDVTCSQSAPTSSSSNGYAILFGASANLKNEIVDDYNSHNCSQDVVTLSGGDISFQFGLASNSYNNIGLGAFNDALYGFRTENATNAVSVSNAIGPHLIMHNDFAGSAGTIIDCPSGCGYLALISNQQDSAAVTTVNPHSGGGHLFAVNNRNSNFSPIGFNDTFVFAGPASSPGAYGANDWSWLSGSFRYTVNTAAAAGTASTSIPSAGVLFDTVKFNAGQQYDHFSVQVSPEAGDNSVGFAINYLGSPSSNGYIGLGATVAGLKVGPTSQTAASAPSVGFRGTSGATTWSYLVQANTITGHSDCSAVTTINNGNAALNGTNFNHVGWDPYVGAMSYSIYRTAAGGAPATTGLIGIVPAHWRWADPSVPGLSFNDTGLAGDASTCTAGNTTGGIQGTTANFSGQVSAQSFVASGANGGISAAEGDCSAVSPAPGAGVDVLCPNSIAHAWQLNNNNGGYFNVAATVKSGTATMTTAAIGSGACGATVTVAATGVATTDAIAWSYNAAPAANPAELVVSSWPTANNVNFQYCNPSAGSITPAAATLNWRVGR